MADDMDREEDEPLKQMNFKVPSSFWREFHDYCRLNDYRKVDVLREAFELHKAKHDKR